jgi:hypothetical protein
MGFRTICRREWRQSALGIAPENLNILKTLDNDNGFARLDQQINTTTASPFIMASSTRAT